MVRQMKSYVISVSLGTGCYRHIQISANATLYKLHKAILGAFDFEDDHAHAFFMDNHWWSEGAAFFSMKLHGDERLTKSYKLEKLGLSKGSQFKYIFDFGEEWRFQCKLLREIEEQTAKPTVIKSVGVAPEQYPDFEEEELGEADEEDDIFPEILPDDVILSLLRSLPIPMETVWNIHAYFEAAARLYGVIPVRDLLRIYNSQNEQMQEDVFLVLTEMIRHEQNAFSVLARSEVAGEAAPTQPTDWEIIDDSLLLTDPDEYWAMLRGHKGKEYKILPKEEFLQYADMDYYPATPQSFAMKQYLLRRGDLPRPIETWMGIQTMIEADFSLDEVLNCVADEGLVFDGIHDIGEFFQLFQELNNHTRKQINRGHTPDELFAMSYRGQQLALKNAPVGQLSLFGAPTEKPKLTLVGGPSRNSPCPCGSGRKYKNCCGKNK